MTELFDGLSDLLQISRHIEVKDREDERLLLLQVWGFMSLFCRFFVFT